MTRLFRQGDLARALRAAKAAGFNRVEFDPATGRYLFREVQAAEGEAENFFDRKLSDGDDRNPEHS